MSPQTLVHTQNYIKWPYLWRNRCTKCTWSNLNHVCQCVNQLGLVWWTSGAAPPHITAFGEKGQLDDLWGHPGVGPRRTHLGGLVPLSGQTEVCDLQGFAAQVVPRHRLQDEDWGRQRQRRGRGSIFASVVYAVCITHKTKQNSTRHELIKHCVASADLKPACISQRLSWFSPLRSIGRSPAGRITQAALTCWHPVSSTSFATKLHHSSSFMLNYFFGGGLQLFHVDTWKGLFLSFTHISLIYVLQFGFVF